MYDGTLKQIREIGEEYIKDYLLISMRNCSGSSEVSDFVKLKDKYELFSDTGFISTFLKENEDPPGQENSTPRKLSIFLALHSLLNATGQILDDINRIECSLFTSNERRNYSARQLGNIIPFEKNNERRNRLNNLRNERIPELKKLYYLLNDEIKSRVRELGFRDTKHFYFLFLRPGADLIIDRSEKFISDTEYLYKDLLKWFTKRNMQMDISVLKKHDLDFMLNSYELTDMFPKQSYKYILETGAGQLCQSYSRNLFIDETRKPNKLGGVSVFPLNPPAEINICLYPASGISYYIYLMGGYGIAQCYSHISRDEYFEFRYLADQVLVNVFMNLFIELVYEPKWINKVLGYLPDGDIVRFLHFRKLKETRESALNASFMLSVADADRITDHFNSFREKHLKVLLCDTDEYRYLQLLREPNRIMDDFTGIVGGTVLKNYLVNNYDEQWWRSSECGEYLHGLWEMGGRADFLFLEKDIKLDPVNIKYIYDELNKYV